VTTPVTHTLCIYGDPHQTTPEAIARNRKGGGKLLKCLVTTGSKSMRERLLQSDLGDPGFTCPQIAWLPKLPRFDFESFSWPSQFHHTGRSTMGKVLEDDVNFPLGAITGEPLVYANGTILKWSRGGLLAPLRRCRRSIRRVSLVLSIWRCN